MNDTTMIWNAIAFVLVWANLTLILFRLSDLRWEWIQPNHRPKSQLKKSAWRLAISAILFLTAAAAILITHHVSK